MRRNEPRGRLLALTLLILGAALLAQVLGGLAGLVLLGAVLLGVVWDLARHLEGHSPTCRRTAPSGSPCGGSPPLTPPWFVVCVGAALLAEMGHLPWTEAGERYFAAALVLAAPPLPGEPGPQAPL